MGDRVGSALAFAMRTPPPTLMRIPQRLLGDDAQNGHDGQCEYERAQKDQGNAPREVAHHRVSHENEHHSDHHGQPDHIRRYAKVAALILHVLCGGRKELGDG